MFGSIGFPELMVILTIALLIFGPRKLPEIGRSIGKALREFRKTSDEIKDRIEEEINAEEFREIKRDINQMTDLSSRSTPKPSTSEPAPSSAVDPYRDLEKEPDSSDIPQEPDEEPPSQPETAPSGKDKGHGEDEKIS